MVSSTMLIIHVVVTHVFTWCTWAHDILVLCEAVPRLHISAMASLIKLYILSSLLQSVYVCGLFALSSVFA